MEKLFAVGTIRKDGVTWSTIKASSKREAKKLSRKNGQVIRVAEIKA
jgi:hypothetical protein